MHYEMNFHALRFSKFVRAYLIIVYNGGFLLDGM